MGAPESNDTMAMEITARIARHLVGLKYEHLTPDAITAAKRFMLDTLAVGWAGSDSGGCGEARAMMVADGGAPASTVWCYGDRLPPSQAAFLNSMFAAALDFDSLGRDSPSHVNVVVLPAALAVAEQVRASGRDFLTALVAGCDLMCRLGASAEALGQPHKGWFFTSVHGVFGATAAVAKLLRLDAAQTQHALGMAFSQAAGTQQANIEPSLTKRMQSAFAARNGVFVSHLAKHGLTAPKQVIEGQCGLFALYQGGDVDRLFRGIGSVFENTNLSIKKYPSCGCNHTAIEAALKLRADHGLKPSDVERMEITISPFMDRLVGGPFDPSGDPQVAAQFNIRYSLACAMVRGKLGLAELENDAVFDPVIGRLVDRVEVKVDPANNGKRGPAHLAIRTAKGETVSCSVEHVPGDENAPMSEEEIRAKCVDCFGLGASPVTGAACDRLMARIGEVEKLGDMNALLEGFPTVQHR